MNEFDTFIEKKFGTCDLSAITDEADITNNELNEDIYELYESHYEDELREDTLEVDEVNDHELFIDTEVMLPKDGLHLQAARVIGRSKDKMGNKIGHYSANPILNTQIYDVLYPDGSVVQLSANMIAENIFRQVDEDGYRYQHLRNIINHRMAQNAVPKSESWTESKNGNKSRRHTTKGWFFEVEWLDGTSSWVPLKDLKQDHPIELAEYCNHAGLMEEAAIVWWASYVLKKKDKIISQVKSRSKKKSQKYGVEIPRNVKEALELDRINNNHLWSCLLYTSPSPRDRTRSRMPSSA